MNRLIQHIEYLLRNHNCVIVPNLGGFIVNSNAAKRDGIAALHAPYSDLVFNKELTHNDGLLLQSYMKTHKLTSDEATRAINEAVSDLRHKLREEKSVDLGDMGVMKMNSDSRFIYVPKPFVHPAFFGLTHTTLKPVIQLRPDFEERTKQKSGKNIRRKAIITTAAASIIGLILFVLPVQDNPLQRQHANLLSEKSIFENKTTLPEYRMRNENPVAATTISTPHAPAANYESTIAETNSVPNEKIFYIIMGVYEVNKVAEQITEKLKSEGFNHTAWLHRSGRINVYVDSFSDRDLAETYLREVRKKHPEYRDAWVLKYDK